jgi:hypothetical protein
MTKDRARKQAARQRAARTGERYVVAQRFVEDAEPQPPRDNWLHEATHGVPGVPPHADGGLQARAPGRRGSRKVNPVSPNRMRNRAHTNNPRVLVAWQNWIARRFGVGSR